MKAGTKPPRLAEQILRWYSERAQIDDLHGDVDELFQHDLRHKSIIQANLNYWQRVISLIFSYAITKRKRDAAYHHFSYSKFNPAMFKNYFNTARRNLSKNMFFTTLNVFGLAVGMSLSLLFVAMVVFVYQYDNFHPNRERIYRVITHVKDPGRKSIICICPHRHCPTFKGRF